MGIFFIMHAGQTSKSHWGQERMGMKAWHPSTDMTLSHRSQVTLNILFLHCEARKTESLWHFLHPR